MQIQNSDLSNIRDGLTNYLISRLKWRALWFTVALIAFAITFAMQQK